MSVEECSHPHFGTGVRIRSNHHLYNVLLQQPPVPSCAPGLSMCALVSERAHMGFLGAHGVPGRLRTYFAPAPNPSREAITPSCFRASWNKHGNP
jgi:hypothetical protein